MKFFPILATAIHLSAVFAQSETVPPFEGYADQVSAREAAWAATDKDTPKQIRIRFHIVRSSRWDANSSAPLTDIEARAKVDEALGQVNSIYSTSRIEFVLDPVFDSAPDLGPVRFTTPSGNLRNIDSFDEKGRLMRDLISNDDARTALNIVVVPMQNLGFDGHADLPWSRNSLRRGSGVMVSEEFVFPPPVSIGGGSEIKEAELNPQILAHEIGHALGLHHLERGVAGFETGSNGSLTQNPAVTSSAGDTKGDFCHDTPPISYFGERDFIYKVIYKDDDNSNVEVSYPAEQNNVLPWDHKAITNLMRVSGDRFVISLQQSQRMHSWIDARLRSWVIGTDASDPSALLSSLYFNSQKKFVPGVRLIWSGSAGSHVVERSTTPTFQESEILTSSAATAWDDTTAKIGVEYWYRLKKSGGSVYTYSRRVSIRGLGGNGGEKARPAYVPTLAEASAVRSIPNGVLVTWEDSEDIDIAGYQVRRWDMTNPASPVRSEFGPITSGAGEKASFFDVFTEGQQVDRDGKDIHYQILSFSGDYANGPVFSGNVAAPLEQGRKLKFSATPPPAPPVLSYTKYQAGGSFKGRVSVRYRGVTPASVTANQQITASLSRSIDGVSVLPDLTTMLDQGQNNPVLFTESNLDTGKNYFYELSLSQNVTSSNGVTTLVNQSAVDFSTIRIPGRITSSPVRGQPAHGTLGTSSYPTFTWAPILDAEFYKIIINRTGISPITHTVPASQLSFRLEGGVDEELTALERYNWKILATNDEGDGPVSGKGFFTVGLRAVGLTSPVAGEELVAESNSVEFVHPTFTWDGMPGAVEYRLRVFDSEGNVAYKPDDPVFRGGNSHTVTGEGLPAGNYTWDVTTRPIDPEDPTPNSFSEVRSFSVRTRPTVVPAQYSPLNMVSGARQRPIFEWEKVAQATDYVIHIVQKTNIELQWRFGGTTNLQNTNLLGVDVPLVGSPVEGKPNRLQFEFPASLPELAGARQFYWRIRARNEVGNGDWSAEAEPAAGEDWKTDWHNFFTRIDAPTLVSPADGATTGDTSPTLRWESGTGSSSNEVQVFSGSIADANLVASQTVSGDSWDIPQATNELGDGTYVWRVRSTGPPGQDPLIISGWKESTFTVLTPPRFAPIPVNPYQAGGEQLNRQVLPNFQWTPRSKQTSFRLEILQGNTTVFNRAGITGTGNPITYTLPAANALAYGTQYTWRVTGASSVGEGPSSSLIPFRTELPASAPSTPVNGTVTSEKTPILRAVTVPSATRYEFQLRKGDPGNEVSAEGVSQVGTNRWTVDPSLNNATYYWRVRAIGDPDDKTNGPWSGYFTLMIEGVPTNAPTQLTPADDATNTAYRPTFTWTALSNATSYDLQVVDASGGAVVFEKVGIVGTEFRSNFSDKNEILEGNHSYFWRMRGRNAAGAGPWSATYLIWSEYFKLKTKP